MSTPLSARYTDGVTAREHRVQVQATADGLSFDADGKHHVWPVSGLLLVERVGGVPRMAHDSYGEARLVFDSVVADTELKSLMPGVMAKSRDRLGLDLRRVAMIGGATIGVIALIFFSLPALTTLAVALVPLSYEKELGEETMGTLTAFFEKAGDRCEEPEGLAALEKMTAKLIDGRELRIPVDVRVAPVDIVNALALPGGTVIVFEELLKEAESAEEVAGVIAHEIGHAQYRHGMQRLLQGQAIDALISIVTPGEFGSIGRTAGTILVSQSYNRDAEREADGYAIETLNRIGVTAGGMAAFFERAPDHGDEGEDEAGAFRYLVSHPASGERAATIRAESQGEGRILTDAEWQALKGICGQAERPSPQ
ncbi:MAG: M48 family metallopeptidase [Minwuia sp.]|uniref:M48 family metallopeptidase n=1 Tax=Minwuia sp. TaxID=2493630 RepID=UPI003A89C2DA